MASEHVRILILNWSESVLRLERTQAGLNGMPPDRLICSREKMPVISGFAPDTGILIRDRWRRDSMRNWAEFYRRRSKFGFGVRKLEVQTLITEGDLGTRPKSQVQSLADGPLPSGDKLELMAMMKQMERMLSVETRVHQGVWNG
jgi:hypothetical protein